MLGGARRDRDHVVQFYEDESVLLDEVARFVGGGIGEGECVLVVARAARLERLRDRLTADAIDLHRVEASGRVAFFDAEATLASFMVDGMPDVGRFLRTVGRALVDCQRARPKARVRVYGEMVDILWQRGNRAATIALEGLWNELAREQAFRLLCAYAVGDFASAHVAHDFDALCWAHTHVVNEPDVRQRDDTYA